MTGLTETELRPADLRSAVQALADTEGAVCIRGAGTAQRWAGTPEPAATVLDTGELSGVVEYNPADMTVAVRAGTKLTDLQAELAGHGQRLAFDAARAERGATVGGLVATADSGPLALAYGSMRDLMIGATIVLADGTVARSGGHVIKNVAGYDLTKLMHGSYGTFALLAEVVLRLHPIPAAERTIRLECPLPDAGRHAATVLASALEPVALEWADGELLCRLEGTAEGTRARAGQLAELVGGAVLTEDDARVAWERHATLVRESRTQDHESRTQDHESRTQDHESRTQDGELATVRIGCRPSRLPELLDSPGATGGLGTGIGTVHVPPGDVDDVHHAVTGLGGTSVLRDRPPGGPRAWGGPPSAVRVVKDLKNELDPQGRLGAGRFETWFGDGGKIA